MSAVRMYTCPAVAKRQPRCGTPQEMEDLNSRQGTTITFPNTETASGRLRHAPDEPCLRDETLSLADVTESNPFKQMQTDIKELKDKLARWEALAVLQEPVGLFRLLVARKMGYKKWIDLAGDLRLERNREGPVRTALNGVLQQEGLLMATWDDLSIVADASNDAFHSGIALPTEELQEKVKHGLLPSELSSSQSALTRVLDYLRACGY